MEKPKIAIIGPGVVGQATGKAFISKGFDVGFIGVNAKTVNSLRKNGYDAYYFSDFTDGNYKFDISFFTVPTPTVDGKLDLSAIKSVCRELGKRLRYRDKYHLVVVKSTVLPSTTENVVIPLIEKYSGKKVGEDFGVCMNPEYLREETAFEDSLNPWAIVIGQYDNKSGNLLQAVCERFNAPTYKVSLKEAEIQKYVHNLFNATKITFFNEMREIAKAFGLDTDRIFLLTALSAEGMWNPKYGIKNKGPFSGSCLPKDTQSFLSWAKDQDFEVEVLESVIDVNRELSKKQSLKENRNSYKSQLPL